MEKDVIAVVMYMSLHLFPQFQYMIFHIIRIFTCIHHLRVYHEQRGIVGLIAQLKQRYTGIDIAEVMGFESHSSLTAMITYK